MTVLGLFDARRMHCCFCGSKSDLASETVKKLAYEAYPDWRVAHPGAVCPTVPDELLEYMNNKELIDPWGSRYEITCLDESPWIVVRSLGEDAIRDTADDLWSR